MPHLHRLSDADPAAVMTALEEAWAAGDAGTVLPPDAAPASLPAALRQALDGGEPLPAGTAVVVATSGSTGGPRAIPLTRTALANAVMATHRRLDARSGERWALALPVRHVAGLMVLLRARALGTDPILVPPGDPAALAAASGTAAHVAVVPTQLVRALDAGRDLTGYRTVLVGGGPAPDALLDRARATGVRVVTSYGMSETCGGCVYDGVPLDGTEVALDADGRIRIRGPIVASQELDGTPLQDEDGWFTTSDRGQLEGGRLEVLGRVDDVIISGGLNVDAAAVADVLQAHPAVIDAAVVGAPDPTWGRVVRAVVVVQRDVTLADLRSHVAARLGAAHAPRELLVVAHIPREAMGKLTAGDRAGLASTPPTEVYSPA